MEARARSLHQDPKERQDPTERTAHRKKGYEERHQKGMQTRSSEEQGQFQPFKLLKMLDKLFRNKQALPF